MTFLLKINQIIPGICKYNLILHFISDLPREKWPSVEIWLFEDN